MLRSTEHAAEARLSETLMVQELQAGRLLQASNHAWHATKHAINAAAVSHGREPVTYREKRLFLQELASESGDGILWNWMRHPWRLHGNADQGFMQASEVAESVRITELLIDRLLTIAGYP